MSENVYFSGVFLDYSIHQFIIFGVIPPANDQSTINRESFNIFLKAFSRQDKHLKQLTSLDLQNFKELFRII